ncbi:hypothetical protein ABIA39_006280 [Nocardia sp. GAS34]|uniref:hypothetical protein n=1 Tax=unclassified Nocardia TaxID=2637762 RepID=UPI003D1E74E7
MSSRVDGSAKRYRTAIGAVIPMLAAVLMVAGIAVGAPAARADAPGVPCLWAGSTYRQGLRVYAGGWAFTCHKDLFGVAYWTKDGATNHHSTVPNPGATGNPEGNFSAGAWQPGTQYNDYCVGDQLIQGSGDIFTAVTDSTGLFLYWRSAGPISLWDFDSGVRPGPSWRSSSMCMDGVLS